MGMIYEISGIGFSVLKTEVPMYHEGKILRVFTCTYEYAAHEKNNDAQIK